MSPSSTLALVAPENPGIPPETVLLGLPILRRTVLSAQRAGFERIVVVQGSPELGRSLEGTAARMEATAPEDAVRLPWNAILSTNDLKAIRAGAANAGVPVHSAADLPRAEKHLLRSLIKDTEGFMSRHFDRKISLAISRRLAGTRVTPNQMTVVSVAIGVFGSLFFLSPAPGMQVAGALCFLLHSIVDGCDGELARLRFQESRYGGLLDFWGDNLVHLAVYTAIAVGWSRAIGRAWPLGLGAAAVVGNVLSAAFVYRHTMGAQPPQNGPLFTSVSKHSSRMSRVADELARRDFIYLVLILSAFGKAHWFLVMAAAGAPIFFLVLVGIAYRQRGVRAARSPS